MCLQVFAKNKCFYKGGFDDFIGCRLVHFSGCLKDLIEFDGAQRIRRPNVGEQAGQGSPTNSAIVFDISGADHFFEKTRRQALTVADDDK